MNEKPLHWEHSLHLPSAAKTEENFMSCDKAEVAAGTDSSSASNQSVSVLRDGQLENELGPSVDKAC